MASKSARLASIALLGALIASIGDRPGVTWDEPGYIEQGESYIDWIAGAIRLHAGADDPIWTKAYPDHPPLAKAVYGIAIKAVGNLANPLAAARGASAVLFAVLLTLVLLSGSRAFGPAAGRLAALSLLLMPQVVAHARLAALDLPMTLAWFAVAAASLFASPTWASAAMLGVLWGMALLVKVNGVLLAGPLFLWTLATGRLRWYHAAVSFVLGVFILCAGWPWLWDDTLTHLRAYFAEKQNRWIVPTLYFGQTYSQSYPPWHYLLVLTAVTMPVVFLWSAAIGAWRVVRPLRPEGWWIAIHLVFTLGVACMPGVPRYDGTRLFLSAFPFLAILCGIGFAAAWQWSLGLPSRARAAVAMAATAAFVATVVTTCQLNPFLLSSYSVLIGGVSGAQRLGLETTYWADAVNHELLQHVPPGARIGAVPLGIGYVRAAQAAGMLRRDARPAPENQCDLLIVLGRTGMLSDDMRRRFAEDDAVAETRRGGVTLARLLRECE